MNKYDFLAIIISIFALLISFLTNLDQLLTNGSRVKKWIVRVRKHLVMNLIFPLIPTLLYKKRFLIWQMDNRGTKSLNKKQLKYVEKDILELIECENKPKSLQEYYK